MRNLIQVWKDDDHVGWMSNLDPSHLEGCRDGDTYSLEFRQWPDSLFERWAFPIKTRRLQVTTESLRFRDRFNEIPNYAKQSYDALREVTLFSWPCLTVNFALLKNLFDYEHFIPADSMDYPVGEERTGVHAISDALAKRHSLPSNKTLL